VLRVGLTGGIACGKSRVVARLASAGLPVIDLDVVAHELMSRDGAAVPEVVGAFGPGIRAADGGIDRKALGALVFSDAAARGHLNAILHPRIRAEEARRAAAFESAPMVVTDGALLIEAGVHLRFDRLVVVRCAPEAQLRRLTERDGIGESAARARIEAQMPLDEKRRYAHFAVDTSGTEAETDAAADRLAADLRALAAAPPRRVEVPTERALGLLLHGPRRGPRGLEALALLREITGAEAGGLVEMERVSRLLVPAAEGPWYRAARNREGDPGPEALAAPVALWALSRAGLDRDFLAAAAFSLARLTHAVAGRLATACLYALAVGELAARGHAPRDLGPLERLAERWGGAAVPDPPRAELPRRLEVMAAPVHAAEADAGLRGLLERL
jgi:dephospho-CoA kinase